jgi:hypothetical protein
MATRCQYSWDVELVLQFKMTWERHSEEAGSWLWKVYRYRSRVSTSPPAAKRKTAGREQQRLALYDFPSRSTVLPVATSTVAYLSNCRPLLDLGTDPLSTREPRYSRF